MGILLLMSLHVGLSTSSFFLAVHACTLYKCSNVVTYREVLHARFTLKAEKSLGVVILSFLMSHFQYSTSVMHHFECCDSVIRHCVCGRSVMRHFKSNIVIHHWVTNVYRQKF